MEEGQPLDLEAVIGLEGNVKGGLVVRRDGSEIIYALGATIVVRSAETGSKQEFLRGHNDRVSCLAISPSGRYLASGQVTNMGFTAEVLVWDLERREVMHRLALHKVKVESLSFSPDEAYLASLGGEDDNSLVVWDVESGAAICGSPTTHSHVSVLKFLNTTSAKLVTAGSFNVTVWDLDKEARKIWPSQCHLGQLKRIVEAITIDDNDDFMYAGTQSGDVLKVSIKNKLFKSQGPGKARIPRGVTAITLAPDGEVLIGGGDGSLLILDPETMKKRVSAKVEGRVTSLALCGASRRKLGNGMSARTALEYDAFCATEIAEIFHVRYQGKSDSLSTELVQSCHPSGINDVCFPRGYSEVFATAGANDIRLWHLRDCRELLRITVPNASCDCVAFMPDGRSIISGWSDCCVRAFTPQSGRLLYTINNAHQQAVTAIAATSDSKQIVTGGREGQVRVWRIGPQSQSMIATMKQHKNQVNQISIRSKDDECISASSDGSCIVWDLRRFTRANTLFASTFFKAAVYHPDESQIVTTGTDRQLTWWDAHDGSAIRIISGSDSAAVNTLDISPDGVSIASGGADCSLRVWHYDEGSVHFTGKGHSDVINKVRISPDQQTIISVGSEGAIFLWQHRQPSPSSLPGGHPQGE